MPHATSIRATLKLKNEVIYNPIICTVAHFGVSYLVYIFVLLFRGFTSVVN